MLELFGVQLGTVMQTVTAGTLLTILGGLITVWIRGIPERVRVRMELGAATVEAWKALEKRVNAELDECRRQREADAQLARQIEQEHNKFREDAAETIVSLRDENFRVKLALDITLDGLLRKDPNDEAAQRAKAVMLLSTGPQRVGTGNEP